MASRNASSNVSGVVVWAVLAMETGVGGETAENGVLGGMDEPDKLGTAKGVDCGDGAACWATAADANWVIPTHSQNLNNCLNDWYGPE